MASLGHSDGSVHSSLMPWFLDALFSNPIAVSVDPDGKYSAVGDVQVLNHHISCLYHDWNFRTRQVTTFARLYRHDIPSFNRGDSNNPFETPLWGIFFRWRCLHCHFSICNPNWVQYNIITSTSGYIDIGPWFTIIHHYGPPHIFCWEICRVRLVKGDCESIHDNFLALFHRQEAESPHISCRIFESWMCSQCP